MRKELCQMSDWRAPYIREIYQKLRLLPFEPRHEPTYFLGGTPINKTAAAMDAIVKYWLDEYRSSSEHKEHMRNVGKANLELQNAPNQYRIDYGSDPDTK